MKFREIFVSGKSTGGTTSVERLQCFECVEGTVKVDPNRATVFSRNTADSMANSNNPGSSSGGGASGGSGYQRYQGRATSRSQFVSDGDSCPMTASGAYSAQTMYKRQCAANRCVVSLSSQSWNSIQISFCSSRQGRSKNVLEYFQRLNWSQNSEIKKRNSK